MLSALINTFNLLYLKYLPITYVLILASWFLARKKGIWQPHHFFLPLALPPIWIAIFYGMANYGLNRGKGLANLVVEPIFLALGVGTIYILIPMFLKSGSCVRTVSLIFAMLLLIMMIVLFFPVLPSDI